MEIQKICVAGGGRMGRQIAMCAAIYGVEANVYDLVEAVLTDVEKWADEYLAGRVAKELRIPIIGIGAGGAVDGQVLVVADMLGMTNGFSPRFLRRYADLHSVMTSAISQYVEDVKNCDFPNEKEQY